MRCITSREHPLIKRLVKLQHSAKQRRKEGVALLDGIHLLQSYFASGKTPELLIISESGSKRPEISHLQNQLDEKHNNADCLMLSDTLFNRVSPVKTPSGILTLIRIPQLDPPAGKDRYPFCIMLEAIQDPGNLGSILRSAAAAGARDAFLSTDCADSWSPKTLRAGMGAHFFLNIHENVDLLQLVHQFNGKIVAATSAGADNIYHTDLLGPVMFVLGNEGGGLSEKILKVTHKKVTIPMASCTESLNVAAAAAICLFEKVRQQSLSIDQ